MMYDILWQIDLFIVIGCFMIAIYKLIEAAEIYILTRMHRKHYIETGKCLTCDFQERTEHLPGFRRHHRMSCWKYGEPDVSVRSDATDDDEPSYP